MQAASYAPADPRPETITVEASMGPLLAQTAARVAAGVRSAGTLGMQRQHAAWLTARIGRRELAALDEPALDDLVATWTTTGGARGGPLHVRTVQKILSTLRRAMVLAVRRRELDRLPLFPEFVTGPRKPAASPFRSVRDLASVIRELRPHRQEWVALCFWTAMHASDVERSTWGDVGLSETAGAWITIRNTKNRKPYGRRVVCPEPLADILRAKFQRLCAAGRPPRPTDRLVEPWKNRGIGLARAGIRAGIGPITSIQLRHAAASVLVRRTGITVSAQEWLGHNDPKMLATVYAHALAPALGDSAAELDSWAAELPTQIRRGPHRK